MSKWDDEQKQEQSWKHFVKGMKAVWSLIGDKKPEAKSIIAWIAFSKVLEILFPYILKMIFDDTQKMLTSGNYDFYHLYKMEFVLYAICVAMHYFHSFSVEKRFFITWIYLENHVPTLALKKLLSLPIEYHERENIGKKISKIEKGYERFIEILARLRWDVIPELFYLILCIIFIFVADWRMGLIFSCPFIPAAWVNLSGWRKYMWSWERWDILKEESSGKFVGSISNVRTVKNFVQEDKEVFEFSKLRQEMKYLDVDCCLGMQRRYFIMNMFLKTFFIITLGFGLNLVLKGELGFGTIVFVMYTGNKTFDYLWQIINQYTEISKKLYSVIRIKELLEEEENVVNYPDSTIPEFADDNLKLQNVYFKYQTKITPALKGISLDIKQGSFVALAGESGGGKSTTLNLLNRVYDVTNGEILLNGKDIKKIDRDWFRKLFAVVPQEVEIFDDTVAYNIKYGHLDAPDDLVEEALQLSRLDMIINDKEKFIDGIHTQVGERGVRLSGGEKQRIGIARAYLAIRKGAKFLILDEATSHLDSKTELDIQNMIEEMRKSMSVTIIACAHRLSTIQKADWIYFINNGEIVEQGSHERLMNQENGFYQEVVRLQQLGELE